jgi:hypothetical protein
MRLGKGLDPRAYDIHLDKRKRVRESKNKGITQDSQRCQIEHSKRLKDWILSKLSKLDAIKKMLVMTIIGYNGVLDSHVEIRKIMF